MFLPLSLVCQVSVSPEVMGSITLDRPGLRLPSGGPAPFSRVLIHPPEGTLAYRRGTEDTVSPKVTTPRFPESQGSPSLSSGSVVLVAAGSPDSAAGSPAYRETTCGWT